MQRYASKHLDSLKHKSRICNWQHWGEDKRAGGYMLFNCHGTIRAVQLSTGGLLSRPDTKTAQHGQHRAQADTRKEHGIVRGRRVSTERKCEGRTRVCRAGRDCANNGWQASLNTAELPTQQSTRAFATFYYYDAGAFAAYAVAW